MEEKKLNLKEDIKFYILGLIFIIIQSSVLVKYISFLGFTPNLLLILLIVFSLNSKFLDSLKFSIFLGIFKDLLNPSYIFLDLPLYVIYILIISFIKKRLVSSNQLIRSFIAFSIFSIDFAIKTFITYIKIGQIDINEANILNVIFNTSVFFFVDNFFLRKKEINEE